MILCSCNVLTKTAILAAAEALVAADPLRPVTPGRVFRVLGVRPNCGSCVDLIRAMLRDFGLPMTCPEPLAPDTDFGDDDEETVIVEERIVIIEFSKTV
jgi:bacterioferritin-associated ferredoxin